MYESKEYSYESSTYENIINEFLSTKYTINEFMSMKIPTSDFQS